MLRRAWKRTAKLSYALAALLLGLPLPFVIIAALAPGCSR